MKQLHNISNIFSVLPGQDPRGNKYACVIVLDSEFVDKRCLYKTVS